MTTKEYIQKMKNLGFTLTRIRQTDKDKIDLYFRIENFVYVRVREDKDQEMSFSVDETADEEIKQTSEEAMHLSTCYVNTPIKFRGEYE